jgi:EmrB/QacA subfamily drug resistance transporter
MSGASGRSAMLLTGLVASAFFMEMMDGTVIATALPTMARSFHVGVIEMNIGMTAYLLTLAVFIPVSGWMADRMGARTTFVTAIGVFTAASVLCGFAHSLVTFTAMRVVQGMGGAMMVPVGRLVVLRATPKERLTEALMYITWPGMIALVVGPPLGGFITTYASWPWIFFLNLPVGVLAAVLAWRWIENVRETERTRFDWPTFLLAAVASTGLVYAMEVLGAPGAQWQRAAGVLGVSALSAAAAVSVARRRPATALIDLESMQLKGFAQSVYGGTAYRTAVSVLPFLLPLMFQVGFGLSAFRSGLYVLTLFGGDLSMKALVVPVLRRWGFRQVLIANGVITAGSIAVCALLEPWTPIALLVMVLFVHGMCRSLEFTAIGTLAYAEIPERRMSRANGFLSAVVQLGMGLGVPVGAISLRLMARMHGDPVTRPAVRDFHGAIAVAALLALGPVVNAFRLPGDAGSATSGHRRTVVTEPA